MTEIIDDRNDDDGQLFTWTEINATEVELNFTDLGKIQN